MAGIPKRRAGERRQSYRLRCVEAEYTRRKNDEIEQLGYIMQSIRMIHERTENWIDEELVRYWRAFPGTEYDRTARNNRKRGK
jgi:hypothetical protein